MSDQYLQKLLGQDEKVLRVARQHWTLLIGQVLPEVLLFIAIIVLTSIVWAQWLPGNATALGYLLLILPAISLLWDVLRWSHHQVVVTTRRVIQITGVFNKSVVDSSLEKVNDVKMDQSFWGRIFGFGDIEILTASEYGVNRFPHISDPVGFKTALVNAKGIMGKDMAAADKGEGD